MGAASVAPLEASMDWNSLGTLCFCLAVNMYTLTALFPYVGFMVASFDGAADDEDAADRAGFLAGFVASSFTLGRTLMSYFWGWAADRFGRKPVMIWSMFSMAMVSIVFGMSESFEMALMSRLFLGLLNGAMSTGRALVPELARKDNVVTAMSYVSGAKAIGMTFGPAIGGIFAEPTINFPSIFPPTGLYARYPYLLPNVIGAGMALMSIPLVMAFIPETKPRQCSHALLCVSSSSDPKHGVSSGKGKENAALGDTSVVTYVALESGTAAEGDGLVGSMNTSLPPTNARKNYKSINADDLGMGAADIKKGLGGSTSPGKRFVTVDPAKPKEPGLFGKGGLLAIPKTPVLLFVCFLYSAVIIGFDEAYPLWTLSSLKAGGLAWSTFQIGEVLGISGIGIIIFEFGAYPWFVDRIGIVPMQRWSGILSIVLYLALPNVKFLSWNVESLLVVQIIMLAVLECANTAMDVGLVLASTNPAPPSMRGKLSGLYLTSQSLGRTVGPACWAVIFAWSISTRGGSILPLVDYHLVFNFSAFIMLLVVVLSWDALTEEVMTVVAEEVEGSPGPVSGENSPNGATEMSHCD